MYVQQPAADTPDVKRPSRAERRAAALDADITRRRRAAEWADEQQQRREQRRQRARATADYRRTERNARLKVALARAGRVAVLTGTNVGVNAVAVVGQVLALHAAGWPVWAALVGGCIIESVAVYVQWHAHVALVEDDSAVRLRFASYAIAGAVAWLNITHNTVLPVLFGGCSLASPWLWAMYSRHVHRRQLRAAGLIDPRAPKFSALRWILHRRETWQALKWAVRHGEQAPGTAILAVQLQQTAHRADQAAEQGRAYLIESLTHLTHAQGVALQVAEYVAAQQPGTSEAADAIAAPADIPGRVPAESAPLPAETIDGIPGGIPVPDPLCGPAAARYADRLSAGTAPSLATIKKELGVGQPRAGLIQSYLGLLAKSRHPIAAVNGATPGTEATS